MCYLRYNVVFAEENLISNKTADFFVFSFDRFYTAVHSVFEHFFLLLLYMASYSDVCVFIVFGLLFIVYILGSVSVYLEMYAKW